MSIDYAAIAKAGGIGKGRTRKSLKAKKDRADVKALKTFRDAVWQREGERFGQDWHWAEAGIQIVPCQRCGSPVSRGPNLIQTGEVHHRIVRGNKATRYDPNNGILLCNALVNDCHGKAQCHEIEV